MNFRKIRKLSREAEALAIERQAIHELLSAYTNNISTKVKSKIIELNKLIERKENEIRKEISA